MKQNGRASSVAESPNGLSAQESKTSHRLYSMACILLHQGMRKIKIIMDDKQIDFFQRNVLWILPCDVCLAPLQRSVLKNISRKEVALDLVFILKIPGTEVLKMTVIGFEPPIF